MQIYTMAFHRKGKIIISNYSKLQNVKNKIKHASIFVYCFSKIQEIPRNMEYMLLNRPHNDVLHRSREFIFLIQAEEKQTTNLTTHSGLCFNKVKEPRVLVLTSS